MISFIRVARKFLATYTLEQIFEMNDLLPEEALMYLLKAGIIDTEAPTVVEIDVETN